MLWLSCVTTVPLGTLVSVLRQVIWGDIVILRIKHEEFGTVSCGGGHQILLGQPNMCKTTKHMLQEIPRHRIFLANPSDQQSVHYLDVNTEVHRAVTSEIFQSPGCPTTTDVGNKIFLWRWLPCLLSLFAACSQWRLVDAVHRLPGTVLPTPAFGIPQK